MVLLITGKCGTDCYYCPISPEKKGNDVIYANERRILDLAEMLEEARSMDATGTGITGGDPLVAIDRTLESIRMLKEHFGKEHHIHLYTSMVDPEKASRLCEAGLDEIRFHPPASDWKGLDTSGIKEIIERTDLDVGVEIPAIPGCERDLEELILAVNDAGVKFININEFEFSESNWNMMEAKGFRVKDDLSSAIEGSEDIALELMKKYPDIPIHFCSSTFKDGVQLRKRLIRRANVIAKPYDIITEDGTLLKGVIYADDLNAVASLLRDKFRVQDELILIDEDLGRIETAPWILEKISKKLPYRSYIVEEYPTADRMEVERMPLKMKK